MVSNFLLCTSVRYAVSRDASLGKQGPDPGSQWLSYQMPMRSHTACCSAFYVCGVVIWSPSLSSSVLNTYSEAYLLVATRAPADEA